MGRGGEGVESLAGETEEARNRLARRVWREKLSVSPRSAVLAATDLGYTEHWPPSLDSSGAPVSCRLSQIHLPSRNVHQEQNNPRRRREARWRSFRTSQSVREEAEELGRDRNLWSGS